MSGAERPEDLLVWRLMFELSVEVWKFTARPPASRDFKYTEQIRDASDSAQRNVSEGFARFNPPDFVRFLDFSRASATETRSLLQKGRRVGHLDEAEFQRLFTLCERGLQALARLQRYLRSPQARMNASRRYKSKRSTYASNDPNTSNDPNDPNDPNDRND